MEKATLKAIKRKIEIGRERIANMSQLSKNAAKSNEELLMRIYRKIKIPYTEGNTVSET